MTQQLELELARRAQAFDQRVKALDAAGLLPQIPPRTPWIQIVSIVRRAEALRDGRDPNEGIIVAVTANPN